ncbi:hypothetical protein Poli38472_008425 [Pythium oligandrum]|uniref:Zinc finger Mcm10/DnaG-type domain-containing protein n=1 Tax=Pythium oligandrum TaxID=41045 RepID=A0A8K1CP14_PYTOL|nr:hypothetical protein Poli38472_008425 [Pythium oligandrum]|eukprot:TMW65783.1 hypothetical protein Poli38472_008425 [Pythium oligandrum]
MNGNGAGGNGAQWNWTALAQQASAKSTSDAAHVKEEIQARLKKVAKAPRSVPMQRQVAPQPSAPPEATSVTTQEKHDVEKFSRLRIAERTMPAADLETEMAGRRFIPLHAMDTTGRAVIADEEVDWVTIGVLVRKTLSKAAANGSSFMVWALSDLEATELAVFLFDAAYDAHWREMEGAVIAVLNATVLPSNEKDRFALKIAKGEEVVKLGKAVDFGICKGTTSGEARCRLPVNTAKSQFCLHHITSNFMAAGKRRQQLNNSFSTFNKSVFSSKSQLKNISAGVYGVRPTATTSNRNGSSAGGWNPVITNKRKRGEPAHASRAMFGAPMVLSASGAVVQKLPPTAAKATGASNNSSSSSRALPAGVSGSLPMPLPQRSSRGQKIIASLLASNSKNGTLPRPTKAKKVDMMKFMSSGLASE